MALIKELLLTDSRSRIEEWIRSHAMAATMPSGDTLCRVLGHFPFVVTLRDHSIAPHLVTQGYWEMWVTMCLAKRIKPGWHCIDVGASFGYYTLLLAELVGESGRIEAWEPEGNMKSCLEQTLVMNGLSGRVTVRGQAAGLFGDRRLARGVHDYGGARIRAEYVEGSALVQELVHQRPLADNALTRMDFVKLDAGGMEPEAWASLGELLPEAALMEWTPRDYAAPAEFVRLLLEQGYRLGRVTEHGDVYFFTGERGAITVLCDSTVPKTLWLERSA